MKTVKITPTTDYFITCPYCGKYHDTNVDGEIIKCSCGKTIKAEYDRDYFMLIAESNLY